VIVMPSTSKEYLVTTVTASADPTGVTPQFAFTTTLEDPVTWITGEWVDDTTYDARLLVGPGTTAVLTAGLWFCWLKITDSPEVPVRRFDMLRVT
jgi:hypothetical protein